MHRFSTSDLNELMEVRNPSCVSLLMPCEAPAHDMREDRLRLKNLLEQAEEELKSEGVRTLQIGEMTKPAWQIHQETEFWAQPGGGLAIFIAPDYFRCWRVPITLRETVHVNNRFHVKPLLPLLQDDGRFYLLAVSQKNVRLFEASRQTIHELTEPTLPQNLRDALNIDEYEQSLQLHTTGQQQAGGGQPEGRRAAMFHGHGGGDPDDKKRHELSEFFRKINEALSDYLGDYRTPLVFAGVEYLFPIFRETCKFQSLIQRPVTGSPATMSAQELHEQAWPVVEPHFQSRREDAMNRWNEVAGGDLANTKLEEVVRAARHGAVETLFVAKGTTAPGTVDEKNDKVERASAELPSGDDLLDYAAHHTLLNKGKVFVVEPEEVPGSTLASAILRYPLPAATLAG